MSTFALFCIKVLFSAAIVVGITIIAERGKPQLAGVLMGFPLGTGLVLFFMGIEQGAIFAAQSALWAIPGLMTTLAFCLGYSKTAAALPDHLKVGWCLLIATSCGLASYFISSLILIHLIPATNLARIIVLSISLPFFAKLLALPAGAIPTVERKPAQLATTLFRGCFAAMMVVLVTTIAHLVGPAWSGIFATFPMAILPLALILHYNYGGSFVPVLFSETALGMGSLILFAATISLTFPTQGVYLGTAIAYGVAFCYLLIYEFFLKRWLRRALA